MGEVIVITSGKGGVGEQEGCSYRYGYRTS